MGLHDGSVKTLSDLGDEGVEAGRYLDWGSRRGWWSAGGLRRHINRRKLPWRMCCEIFSIVRLLRLLEAEDEGILSPLSLFHINQSIKQEHGKERKRKEKPLTPHPGTHPSKYPTSPPAPSPSSAPESHSSSPLHTRRSPTPSHRP